MNKKKLIIIALALFLLTGCITKNSNNTDTAGKKQVANSEKKSDTVNLKLAPEFSLQDFNGNIVTNIAFAGKPMVINSWATWCPFCKKELVDFVQVQEEFGDEVVVIAIGRVESLKKVKKYTDEKNLTDKLLFLLDPKDSFYQSIGGFSMPETIFVDKDGFIRDHKRGPMELSEIKEKIANLIN